MHSTNFIHSALGLERSAKRNVKIRLLTFPVPARRLSMGTTGLSQVDPCSLADVANAAAILADWDECLSRTFVEISNLEAFRVMVEPVF